TDCSASPSCATSTMSPFRRGSLLASRLASGQCRKIEGSEELQRDEPGLSVPESRELPARNRVVPALHAPMFSWAQCGRAQVHARREVRTDPRGEPYLATRQVASTSTRRDHEEESRITRRGNRITGAQQPQTDWVLSASAALSATVAPKGERKYRAIEDAIDGSWQAAPTLLECYACTRMSSHQLLGGAALKLCAQPDGANVFDVFVAVKMGNDQSQWRAVIPCEWRSLQPIGEQDIFVQ